MNEMERISNRQHQIIEYLLKNGKTKCHNISLSLEVSDKTIRNEIKNINSILKLPLIASDRNGFVIMDEYINIAIQLIKQSLFDENSQLLYHLLLNHSPELFYEISDYFCISPSSLQMKIKNLNQMITSYSLEIVRRDGRLILEGGAYNKHKLFLDLIYSDTEYSFSDLNAYSEYFNSIDISKANFVIKNAISEHGYYISSYYENNLIINILTIISLYASEPVKTRAYNESIPEVQIATTIVNQLVNDELYHDNLINMITYSLVGVIKSKETQTSCSKPYAQTFVSDLFDIVQSCFHHYGINADPHAFLHVFADHVYELIIRLRNGNYATVPHNISIKSSCFYVYDVAVYLCQKLNQKYNIQVPDNEISLIAIHIGFAIESAFSARGRVNLYLYTGQYPLIDTYITEEIIRNFSDLIEIHKIKNLNLLSNHTSNIDLLITTQPYFQNNIYQYCQISPLLTDSDKNKVNHSISKALENQQKKEFNTIIREYFDEELFFIDTTKDNREDVLHFLCNKMEEQQIVDNSFLESVFYRESLSPTCFMNSFAIPHSFEANSIHSKIAVLINREGIHWDNQVIQIVFLIALNKRDQIFKKKLLDGLPAILCTITTIEEFKTVTDFVDFLYLISSNCR